jgi:histidinol-phosphate phosphatase family protein
MRWPPDTAPPGTPTAGPVLFLDRDGVIIIEKDYLADAAGVELVPGVPAALRQARAAGYRLVGVSNQSGLGRGRFTSEQFTGVMRRLDALLEAAGCPLDGFFYCPHAPADGCRCRKPKPGLLEEAATSFTYDPTRSWVIGDKVSDVDLALAAGLGAVLVRTGHGRVQEAALADRPALVADDLPAAVTAILAEAVP